MTTLRWERTEGKYASGQTAFLGKWAVGGWTWNDLSSASDPRKYRALLNLPGMRNRIGDYEREADAKARVEFAVGRWIEGAFPQQDEVAA